MRDLMTRDDQVKRESQAEIAKNLLEMGMSADDVSKGTGLSLDVVEMIRDEAT